MNTPKQKCTYLMPTVNFLKYFSEVFYKAEFPVIWPALANFVNGHKSDFVDAVTSKANLDLVRDAAAINSVTTFISSIHEGIKAAQQEKNPCDAVWEFLTQIAKNSPKVVSAILLSMGSDGLARKAEKGLLGLTPPAEISVAFAFSFMSNIIDFIGSDTKENKIFAGLKCGTDVMQFFSPQFINGAIFNSKPTSPTLGGYLGGIGAGVAFVLSIFGIYREVTKAKNDVANTNHSINSEPLLSDHTGSDSKSSQLV